MKIAMTSVDAIKPYNKNPRINASAVSKVSQSIEEFGFQQPIVVDKKNIVIVGHTRLLAAIELGYKEVPVLVADGLSPKKVKAYRIADNKTNEFADWDFDLLESELLGLEDQFTGFDTKELEKLFDNSDGKDFSDEEFERFSIIVSCDNEGHQKEIYNKLKDQGLTCQALSL